MRRWFDGLLIAIGCGAVAASFVLALLSPDAASFSLFSRTGAVLVLCGAAFEVRRFLILFERAEEERGEMRADLDHAGRRLDTIQIVTKRHDRLFRMILDKLRNKAPSSVIMPPVYEPTNEGPPNREAMFTMVDLHLSQFGTWMAVIGTLVWSFGDWFAEWVAMGEVKTWTDWMSP